MMPLIPPIPIASQYRTLKISLKSILRDKAVQPILFEAVDRVNRIVTHTYQFLRLWMLQQHRDNLYPEITTNLIQCIFRALTSRKSNTINQNSQNQQLYEQFQQFWKTDYQALGYEDLISGKNLGTILQCVQATDILIVTLENGSKMHYPKYLKRYLRATFELSIIRG